MTTTADDSNTDSKSNSKWADRYGNKEDKEKLDAKREALIRQQKAEQAKEAAEKQTAREKLVGDEQPDPEGEKSAKQLLTESLRETITVPFRGEMFEFAELGRDALKVQEMAGAEGDEVERGTEAGNFIYEKFGEIAVGVEGHDVTEDDLNVEFWEQFDLGGDEGNGLVNLFIRVVEESQDVDTEDAEEVQTFRDEH